MKVWFRHVRDYSEKEIADFACTLEMIQARAAEIRKLVEGAVAAGQIKLHQLAGSGSNEVYTNLWDAADAITVCELDIEDGSPKILGYAVCSPRDQFSRKKGRAVSFGRALAELRWQLESATSPRLLTKVVEDRIAEARAALALHERRKTVS